MGIFDAFKKDKNKIVRDINEDENKTNIEEKIEIQPEKEKDNYILTHERCNELLQRIFQDEDHGESMMKESSLTENIFILGYIETSIMPGLKDQGKEQDYMWFYSVMSIYRKIFQEKIIKSEKLWKIILKTTGLPFMDKGCEHILVCDTYKDKMIENLKKVYYDVEVIEMTNEDFNNELNELYRTGYKGMGFSDGIQRPYYLSKESLINFEEVSSSKYFINPETQYSMAAFFQEMRRNINYEGADKIRQNLELEMINSIVKTKFIIPIKKSDVNKADLPVYIISENENDKSVNLGLYVFTDQVEVDGLKKKNFDFSDEWDIYLYDFSQLMKLLNDANISEICINCGSIDFKINEQSLEVIKKQAEIVRREMAEKQDEWEKEILPKMLKDKNVPVIKDSNGTVLFARKDDSVLMSKFIFDILSKRDIKKEIMELFFEDSSMENISLYDFDFRRVTLKIKESENKQGLFIVPMRYDNEDDMKSIDDMTIHYTEDAIKMSSENENRKEYSVEKQTMHFYTIANKDTNKTYIPLFSDEKEAEKIYSRDKFRYCKASYKDIMDNVNEYDGIVINPASMSFIIEKNLLSSIFDIINQ